MQSKDRNRLDAKLLGERIRLARERRGMSQNELASQVEKDQKAISAYERGKRKLAVTDLVEIARVLGEPILFFFEGSLETKDLDRELLEEFRRIPTLEGKRALIEITRTFVEAVNSHYRE